MQWNNWPLQAREFQVNAQKNQQVQHPFQMFARALLCQLARSFEWFQNRPPRAPKLNRKLHQHLFHQKYEAHHRYLSQSEFEKYHN